MAEPDVWYAIPSHRDAQENRAKTLPAWTERGYRVALLVDRGESWYPEASIVCQTPDYRGYPWAVKHLCDEIFKLVPETDLIVTGGDDILPEPRFTAQEIRRQFLERFPDTFGVMQPCGDPLGTDGDGQTAAARICGSPWMGREFIRRINGGLGPFWPEYFHFYCDEEMHEVAKGLGILWNRPDLTQYHNHWSRDRTKRRPEYLRKANRNWNEAKALFDTRKAAGFPGSTPLATGAGPS